MKFRSLGLKIENAGVSSFRVRYSETDKMGYVYYGRYYEWFEVARVEWMRRNGISYDELEKDSYFLPVSKVKCRYFAPLRYDDELTIYTWLIKATAYRFEFLNLVQNSQNGEYTTEAEVLLVSVGTDGKPKRLKESYFNVMIK